MAEAILDFQAFKMLLGMKTKCPNFASPNVSFILSNSRCCPREEIILDRTEKNTFFLYVNF